MSWLKFQQSEDRNMKIIICAILLIFLVGCTGREIPRESENVGNYAVEPRILQKWSRETRNPDIPWTMEEQRFLDAMLLAREITLEVMKYNSTRRNMTEGIAILAVKIYDVRHPAATSP